MTMDDLLASYEDELGIDLPEETSATIAKEINLLKKASQSLLEEAVDKEHTLHLVDSLDGKMANENVYDTLQ